MAALQILINLCNPFNTLQQIKCANNTVRQRENERGKDDALSG